MEHNENDDFFVDDVIANLKKTKKKVNSKDKGVRGESDLCDTLSARFPNHKKFFRVVGSGARVSQVNMSEQMQHAFVGDVVCPEGFLFTIECKYGYKDYDLSAAFEKKLKGLDEFLEQAEKDAGRIGKKPLMCWRKPRQGWLSFMRTCDEPPLPFAVKLYYHEWVCIPLTELLGKAPDDFFFAH